MMADEEKDFNLMFHLVFFLTVNDHPTENLSINSVPSCFNGRTIHRWHSNDDGIKFIRKAWIEDNQIK